MPNVSNMTQPFRNIYLPTLNLESLTGHFRSHGLLLYMLYKEKESNCMIEIHTQTANLFAKILRDTNENSKNSLITNTKVNISDKNSLFLSDLLKIIIIYAYPI